MTRTPAQDRAAYRIERKALSKALLAELAEQARHLCALCGKVVACEDRSVDHIIPLSVGGTDDRANLQLAHVACNRQRGNAPYQRPPRFTRRLPEPDQSLLRYVTERELQGQIEQAARFLGWTVYHTWNSQHSAPGYPDLTLARPPRLLFAELKTETGRLSLAQEQWRDLLLACPGVEWVLWRPSDWQTAIEMLA